MNTVKYNFATNVLRFNHPSQWDPKLVSAVTVTVSDTSGNELSAADSATLQPDTTTRASLERFSTTVYLDASYAGTVSIGDLLKISGVSGSEVVVVKGYNSSTKDVEIDNVLRNEYESGASVYPMYTVYTLDTTDTDVYTNGLKLRITWTPTGAGNATDEIYDVLQTVLEIDGFEGMFRSLYPRAYDVLSKTPGRFRNVVDSAEMRLYCDLMSDGMDMHNIKDQRTIAPVLLALTAFLYTLNGDSDTDDERKALAIDYDDRLAALKKLPIWIDSNLDGVSDPAETTSHQTWFERGW
jgi:hypothetical protein